MAQYYQQHFKDISAVPSLKFGVSRLAVNHSGQSADVSQRLNNKIKKQKAPRGEGVKMKKSIFFGLAIVLVMAFLVGCSDMPTVPVQNDTTPGIKLSQGGKNVDSLLVNIWAAFTVNTGDTTPVSYQWNFGDGTTVNTAFAQTEHRYVTTGTFTASVLVNYSNGGSNTYTRQVRVYQPTAPPSDDILALLSSSQETSGKWTYRIGLATSAYSGGSGANPFITGQPGGVIITNPVNNSSYNWVQLVNQQENGRLIVTVTCWDQNDVFLNYGGNFINGQPASQWNWANIEESAYFVAEDGGGNLHFSLSSGQLLPVGGTVVQLPGLLGDESPATLRLTVGQDSLRFFCNLDRLQNFNGVAWLEYAAVNGDHDRQPLQASYFFSGWAEGTLPLSALNDNPIKIRYGHNVNDLADMTGSKYWVPADGWLEFYLLPVDGGKGGWEAHPTQ